MSLVIRPESSANRTSIREVNILAFGREDEARLVEALRDGGHTLRCRVRSEFGRSDAMSTRPPARLTSRT